LRRRTLEVNQIAAFAHASKTPTTPAPAGLRRRTLEVNQNYLAQRSPAIQEKGVYMTMEVVTASATAAKKPQRRYTAPPQNSRDTVERSDYIDMASFPIKE
jgi:hypothetical protein